LPYSIVYNNILNLKSTINDTWYNKYSNSINNTVTVNDNILDNSEISFVTSKIWDGNLMESSHITSIGNIMYTSYSIWLIITSIILLLAMVGAIVITIKQKK
jgi:NADH-ubiquinone oxidoreductase chain 6